MFLGASVHADVGVGWWWSRRNVFHEFVGVYVDVAGWIGQQVVGLYLEM